MAPEQVFAGQLTRAVDWYAFGVLLYEALTGELPFTGQARELLLAKQLLSAVPPKSLVPSTPLDLNTLAVDLLRRAPEERPSAEEILSRLGASTATPSGRIPAPPSAPSISTMSTQRPEKLGQPSVFVGREEELAMLSRAFEARARGRAVTVLLSGASGMGKSALARRFLETAQQRGLLLVLEGRCYEREAVPYKAMDSVVDRLSEHLVGLAHEAVTALLPPDIDLLTQIFPVLRRVSALAAGAVEPAAVPDQQEHRRRAFSALRELFRRLAANAPLALLIDDLQWGDADSAALLEHLFAPPDPPPILLIACLRDDDTTKSPRKHPLLQRWAVSTSGHDVHHLAIEPLGPSDTRALSEALLAEERTPEGFAPRVAEMIAREAAGSPLFAQELVRHALHRGIDPSAMRDAVRLEDVVLARVAALDEDERKLLEVVAIAGHPVDEPAALAALGGAGPGQRALAKLRALQLLRGRSWHGASLVEPYHDRIRETVARGLTPEVTRAHHLALAEALHARANVDPELLVEHYLEAGAPDRAASFAVLAADRAAQALAFSRAASFYRLALDARRGEREAYRLREKLAKALANAGRGAEAAASFAEAAADLAAFAPADLSVLDFKRRAGEQYLRSGHIDTGIAVLREVLTAVGARLPETAGKSLAAMMIDRALLEVRGLAFEVQPQDRISLKDRIKLETYWSTSLGLAMVDAIRAAYFQTRHERMALELGDPINIARALSSRVAIMGSVGGAANRARCAEVLQIAEQLARRTADPSILMLTHCCAVTAAYFGGDWTRAVTQSAEARQIGRDRCVGVTWEMNTAILFELWSRGYLGDLPELSRRLPVLLKEARERDDAFAETSLRLGIPNLVWLVQDRPDEAEAQVALAMRSWTSKGFHSQHYFELVALVHIALYRGNAARALELVQAAWPRLKGAFLLRLQSIRIELLHLRARAALSVSATLPHRASERARLLRLAAREEARIRADDMGWCAPLADLIGAGVAAERGFIGAATAALERAARGFDGLSMALHAAAARFQRGHLLGENGRREREESRAWMEQQGVLRPEKMTAMLVPVRGGVGG